MDERHLRYHADRLSLPEGNKPRLLFLAPGRYVLVIVVGKWSG
jgi:hypothetical protein